MIWRSRDELIALRSLGYNRSAIQSKQHAFK
jgi:hypothetical protein